MTRLLRLAVGHAFRRKAMSLAAIAVSALAAGAIVTLTGDSANQASSLLRALRDPKSRSLVVRTTNQMKPIPSGVAHSIASLPGVEIAVAFPSAISSTAPGLRDPSASVGYIALETLRGDRPFQITSGRLPNQSEVVVSLGAIRALRMNSPLATGIAYDDKQQPIVGTFEVGDLGAISDLLANAVIGPPQTNADYSTVAFLAHEPADIATIVVAANSLLPDRTSLTVDYEPRAAEIQRTVASSGRRNLAAVAITIVVVSALIQLASSLLNAVLLRRENARRRALGFNRREVVLLGAAEAGLLSLLGATVGVAVACARLASLSAPVEPLQVAATIGLLVTLATLAALPGGTAAALQDPARILRIP
jgi:ABC-type antimicrobial peptide transport system permease subunit